MNIGIDIEEVKRFDKYVSNKKLLNKIFSREEIKYCLSKKNVSQHLAVRFAAKEAVWKALSLKYKNLIVSDISIVNLSNGKPVIFIKNKKYKKVDVSLSHTKNYAAAAAVVF
jgi:holo-[acyl-carrier protein] synthase